MKKVLYIFGALTILFLLTGCNKIPGDVTQILQNLDKSYYPLLKLLVAASYVIGIFFVLAGFYRLKRYGQMRTMMAAQINVTGPLMLIFVGTLLFYFPALVNMSMVSVWGSTSITPYPIGGPNWVNYIRPIQHLVQLVGYFSFLRGWIMLSKIGKQGAQPGIFGKAFMHILGGILAINIGGVVTILGNTLA